MCVWEGPGGSIVVCGASCSANTAELPYSKTLRLGLGKEPVMWEVWIPKSQTRHHVIWLLFVVWRRRKKKTSVEQSFSHKLTSSLSWKNTLMLVKQGDHSKPPELIQTNGCRSLLIIGFSIFTVYTFTVLGTAFWLSVHCLFSSLSRLVWFASVGRFFGGDSFFFFAYSCWWLCFGLNWAARLP